MINEIERKTNHEVKGLVLLTGNLNRYRPIINLFEKLTSSLGIRWIFLITLTLYPSIEENVGLIENSQRQRLKDFNKIGNTIHLNNIKKYNINDIFILNHNISFLMVFGDQTLIERSVIRAAKTKKISTLFVQISSLGEIEHHSVHKRVTLYKFWARNLSFFYWRFKYYLNTETYIKKSFVGSYFSLLNQFIETATKLHQNIGKTCDLYIVFGPNEKKLLMKRKVAKNKIFISHSPFLYDVFKNAIKIKQDSILKQQIYTKLGIPFSKKIFTFATQSFVEHGIWSRDQLTTYVKVILDSVNKVLKELRIEDKYALLIKVHPAESTQFYREFVENHSYNYDIYIERDISIDHALGISFLWISGFSTTVINAILSCTPTIIVNLFNDPKNLEYWDDNDFRNSIKYIDKSKQFIDVLKEIFISYDDYMEKFVKFQSKFVKEYIIGNDKKTPVEEFSEIINNAI